MNRSTDHDQNLRKHEYDGIQELDNPLPRWWLLTFYGTIVFAGIYYVYYQFGPGPTSVQEFQADLAQHESQFQNAQDQSSEQAKLLSVLGKPEVLQAGQKVFIEKCAACHGQKAEGLIGPNLTDQYWLNGAGKSEDIYNVIRDGVPAKGMPPWGPILPAEELISVSAFVHSVVGTNPPNAKAPQGQLHATR